MKLDDLRRLDPKNPGGWPQPVKLLALLVLLLLVVATGAVLDWKDQWETLDRARQEEQKLKDTFLAKKKEAINLDIHKQQLKDIEQSFGALLKQLPNKAEMDALLTDVNQAGLNRGLQFELFKPAPQETFSEFYAELPVSIRVTGSFHDIGGFASDVAALPRIVTVSDISLSTTKDGSLAMDAMARTYRYLDEEEVAKQRKAAEEAKAKAAKGKAPPPKPAGGHK
jgi:type IV pilus assembly protein PilO